MPIIFGIAAAVLALVATIGGGGSSEGDGVVGGEGVKASAAPKAKAKSGRRMSPQDAYAAGAKDTEAKFAAKAAEDAAFEARVANAVKANTKAAAPAPAPKGDES